MNSLLPRHPRLSLAVLFALLSSFLIITPHTTFAKPPKKAAITKSSEYWMGMYMGQEKLGYTRVAMRPTRVMGNVGTEVISDGFLKLKVLGTSTEQKSYQKTLVDAQSRPVYVLYDISSKGSRLRVEATFNYPSHTATCRIGEGKEANVKVLSIPTDASLLSDTNLLSLDSTAKPGKIITQYYLDPISVEFQKATIEVLRKEMVQDPLSGKMVKATVAKNKMQQLEMTYWEGANGNFLRGEMSLGFLKIVMQKESRQAALGGKNTLRAEKNYVPPKDFALATALVTDKPIPSPRELRSLKLNISGIPSKELILSDTAQTVENIRETPQGMSGDYSIEATVFDATKSQSLPIKETSLQPYLAKAPYLNIESPEIIETAKRIRGEEKNLYNIAVKVRNWVSSNMTPDPSISVPRTASDIFANRRGVCRDYSTLFTAIARSAGVPTRLCGGIVYAEGLFFYHAWAECYVGDWVVFDPTLYNIEKPVEYVDATHIKFAQGDVMQMFKVVAIVGKLHIKVQQATR